ncbi:cbb3-type cytochrome oxidase assembly protein CcoS [uncultured Thiodictyon sp.]|uniref:cbb3-type cytochrome oxidase assembly protein CcoS n=1 Tax=uncultured Thiodictyon sp. TaxID=1846217 RepID=UPI0025CF3128|nr:cbb3-type cytochrome oxidase assembly protein CcoS [uncultured Thiodictyon sp.]
MEVIYGLIPGMIILGLAAVAVLFWAARSGQFDDLEGDGRRILMDEDEAEPRREGERERQSPTPAARSDDGPV